MTHQATTEVVVQQFISELLNLILGNSNKNNNSNVHVCIILQEIFYCNSDLGFIQYFYLGSGSHCLSSCSTFSRERCSGGHRSKLQKMAVHMPSAPWPHFTPKMRVFEGPGDTSTTRVLLFHSIRMESQSKVSLKAGNPIQ